MTYVIGLHVNLRDSGGLTRRRRNLLYVLQVVLLPIFSVMEAAGVVLGFVKSEREFYLVKN